MQRQQMAVPTVEEVVFLGAGASKTEKAPLQSELFREYFNIHRGSSSDRTYEKMKAFFQQFFGVNPNQEDCDLSKFPTCEEALGVVEMAISRGEGFTRNSPFGARQLSGIRDALVLAISESISKALQRSYETRVKYHELFAERLGETHENAIISTNYDILIDDALLEKGHEIDYGFDFRFMRYNQDVDEYIRNPGIPLYKIHGSLNWVYCPTCKAVDFTPRTKSLYGIDCNSHQNQSFCNERMIPVLIPPTYMKDFSLHFLRKVWEASESLLRKANRVVFCGYSFPDADIHIKYLIKRVEMNRSNEQPLEVFVVNNYTGKRERQIISEYDRYSRFLKSTENLHYTRLSFEDFCQNGIADADDFSHQEIECMKGNFRLR